MRYFGGMTAEECAEHLSISVHVVRREMRLAKAWLRKELAASDPGPSLLRNDANSFAAAARWMATYSFDPGNAAKARRFSDSTPVLRPVGAGRRNIHPKPLGVGQRNLSSELRRARDGRGTVAGLTQKALRTFIPSLALILPARINDCTSWSCPSMFSAPCR